MIEYNLEPEYENCLDEINRIKKRNENFEWEEIKKFKNSFDGLWETYGFPEDYKEKWDQLVDYMKTFYTLKETAELFGRGYSYYTERAKINELQNTEMAKKINKEILPKLFERVYALLEPKKD